MNIRFWPTLYPQMETYAGPLAAQVAAISILFTMCSLPSLSHAQNESGPQETLEQERFRLFEEIMELQEQGYYAQAIPLSERLLAIETSLHGPFHSTVAEALIVLANLHRQDGTFDKALPLCKRALAIIEKTLGREHPLAVTTMNQLAVLYKAKGEYDSALPLYEETLRIGEQTLGKNHPEVAAILNNLALLYEAKGEYEKALPLCKRAVYIIEQEFGQNHPLVATTVNNLAALYESNGRYNEALRFYSQAFGIFERVLGDKHPNVAIALNNLAALHGGNGNYDKALPMYERALRILENTLGKKHPQVAATLSNLAWLYGTKGDYDQALPLYEQALHIREETLGEHHPSVASTLNNLAELYRSRGEHYKALPLYERALRASEQVLGKKHPRVAAILSNLALLHESIGEHDRALQLCKQALAIDEQRLGKYHPDLAVTLSNLAGVYQANREYDRAISLYMQALGISEQASWKNYSFLTKVMGNLATLYWAKNQIRDALEHFRRADAMEEQSIQVGIMSGAESGKRMFMATLVGHLYSNVAFAIETERSDAYELAAARLLRHKGRVLDDVAASLRVLRKHSTPTIKALLGDFLSTRSLYATQLRRGPGKISAEQHLKNLLTLQNRIKVLERDIGSRSKEFRVQHQNVTVELVQKAIAERAALVEWIRYRAYDPRVAKRLDQWGEWRYAAMVLRPRGKPAWVDLGEAAGIDQLANALSRAMQRRSGEWRQLSRELHARIVAPLMTELDYTKYLYLAPDAALNLIPFAILIDVQGRHLIESHGLSYLTSGRDLLRMNETMPARSAALIVADPDYGQSQVDIHASFKPIHNALEQATQIKALLPNAQTLLGARATEKRLTSIQAPEILHLATHGQFLYADCGIQDKSLCDDAMLKSSLALAGANTGRDANGNDGLLTAHEVAGINLFGTKLVVLSACDTAVGDAFISDQSGRQTGLADGLYGLRRAFVVAGAETQLVTLWRIDADATLDVLTQYYAKLAQGAGRSQALRDIQLAMLGQGWHPYYWASFVLSGNPNAMDGTPRFPAVNRGPRGCGCQAGGTDSGRAGPLALLLLCALIIGIRRLRARR